MKNRSISDNILTLFNTMHFCKKNNIDANILSFDFEKAFDTVEWQALDHILEHLNFGEFFRSAVARYTLTYKVLLIIKALADPGGCRWRAPPQQDQFLSFSHTFLPKSVCVRGWCPPPMGQCPPQWEILDPPLKGALVRLVFVDKLLQTRMPCISFVFHPNNRNIRQ